MKLSPGQSGLEHIAGIHRTFGFAGTDRAKAATREAFVKRAILAHGKVLTGAEWPDPEGLFDQMRERGVGGFGTPTEVARQARRLQGLGINHIAWVSRFGGMPKEAATESLRLLASVTP